MIVGPLAAENNELIIGLAFWPFLTAGNRPK
jgi:hypothetical protein